MNSRFRLPPRIWLLLALCAGALFAQAAPVPAKPDWAALRQQLENNPMHVARTSEAYLAKLGAADMSADALEARLLAIEAYIATEDYDQAQTQMTATTALAHQTHAPGITLRLLQAKASLAQARGQLKEAAQLQDDALRLTQQKDLESERASALNARASLMVREARYNDALTLFMQANELAEKTGQRREVSTSLNGIADVQTRTGNFGLAATYFERAMGQLDARTDKHALSVLTYNYAKMLFDSGNVARAEEMFRSALELSLELKDQVGVAFARLQLGTLAHRKGQTATARQQLEAALEEFVQTDNLDMQLRVRLHLAEALVREHAAAALDQLAQARQLLTQIASIDNELLVHKSASVVLRELGRYKEALAEQDGWIASKEMKDAQFNRKLIAEMQEKFDVRSKETENNLLRSEQQRQLVEMEAGNQRRMALVFALISGALVLVAMSYFLYRQIKSKREYADLALIDTLTGAPNRRHILHYAQLQAKACTYTGNELLLAVIDLDHFKSVNDRFGHDTGDAVLRAFAQATMADLRGGARMGRLGGEEWLLVMPSTRLDQASAIFERLRTAYQAQRPTAVASDFALTFSMGAAQAMPDESIDSLIQRADRAMYRAKQEGRDRIVLADAA